MGRESGGVGKGEGRGELRKPKQAALFFQHDERLPDCQARKVHSVKGRQGSRWYRQRPFSYAKPQFFDIIHILNIYTLTYSQKAV
ncbi:hypothetical protein FACS189445_0480 [Spirochaetia bacterium]|nr:hypothetical protein FACS189445_0480 [Spirochaetia bacterium]